MKTTSAKMNELTREEVGEAVGLWQAVWPQKEFDREKATSESFARWREWKDDSARIHRVVIDGRLAAICRTFGREIRFLGADETMMVLALAGVAADPGQRGLGCGAAVARSAFERVDGGEFPISLFQTGIPEFYAKLGARIVDNPFGNSHHESDPNARPWWDPTVMIYPAEGPWRQGSVDLQGPAY